MKQIIELIEFEGIKRAVMFSVPENTDKAILDFHGNGEMSQQQAKWTDQELIDYFLRRVQTGFPQLIRNGFEIDYLVISPHSWGNNWNMGFAKKCYDYAKEKFGFKYCFGHGISMGGRINNYAETYPNDLIATVDHAGVKGNDPSKRKDIPFWAIAGDSDFTLSVLNNSLVYSNQLNSVGGKGYYTYFKGHGHYPSFWNESIKGTIKGDQLETKGVKKEYVNSHFPIGDWFDSLIPNEEEKPKPIPEPEPLPIPKPTEPMQIEPIQVIGSHPNPEIMFQKSSLKEKPEGYYKIPWNNPKWWAIAEFSGIINIKSINYYDANGKNDFKISFSEDGKEFTNPVTADLGKYLVWRSLNFETRARYIKVEGDNPILPVRIMVMTGDKVEQPKLYNLTITGATEEEKNQIIKIVGNKAKWNR